MKSMRLLFFIVLFLIGVTACAPALTQEIPVTGDEETIQETLDAFSTQVALTPGAYQTPTLEPSPTSTATLPPAVISTRTAYTTNHQNAVVTRATLCQERRGRGNVISGLQKGDRVIVLGRASSAYWAVMNPIYNVPCWVESGAIQLDMGVDPLSIPTMRSLYTETPGSSVPGPVTGTLTPSIIGTSSGVAP